MPRMNAGLPNALLALSALLLTACATTPPKQQDDLCEIFEQEPNWYDHAYTSERRWGVPIAVQMAIVQRESSFRARVRPERTRLLGFIPWRRPRRPAASPRHRTRPGRTTWR